MKIVAGQRLYGFQLKKAAAARVGRNQVLGKLRVRPGGRPKRRLDRFAENRQGFAAFMALQPVNAKQGTVPPVFRQGPVHQLAKGYRPHFIAHKGTSECNKHQIAFS